MGELRIDEPRRVEVSDEAVGAGEGKSVVSVAVRYVNTTNQPVNILTDISIKMEVLGVRLGGVVDPHGACEIPLGDVSPGQARYWGSLLLSQSAVEGDDHYMGGRGSQRQGPGECSVIGDVTLSANSGEMFPGFIQRAE